MDRIAEGDRFEEPPLQDGQERQGVDPGGMAGQAADQGAQRILVFRAGRRDIRHGERDVVQPSQHVSGLARHEHRDDGLFAPGLVGRAAHGAPHGFRQHVNVLAALHAVLLHTEAAIEWLQRAADERDPELLFALRDPEFSRLKADARFQMLNERVNAPRVRAR